MDQLRHHIVANRSSVSVWVLRPLGAAMLQRCNLKHISAISIRAAG